MAGDDSIGVMFRYANPTLEPTVCEPVAEVVINDYISFVVGCEWYLCVLHICSIAGLQVQQQRGEYLHLQLVTPANLRRVPRLTPSPAGVVGFVSDLEGDPEVDFWDVEIGLGKSETLYIVAPCCPVDLSEAVVEAVCGVGLASGFVPDDVVEEDVDPFGWPSCFGC